MLFKHQKRKYCIIAFILLFMLSACVRPLQQPEEEAEATTISETVTEEATVVEEVEAATETPEAEIVEETDTAEPVVVEETPEVTEEAPVTEEETAESVTEEEATEESTAVAPTEEPTEEATSEAATEEATEEASATEETPTPESTEEASNEGTTEEETAEEESEAESQPQARTPTGEIIHTVAPGENLYRIGLQYGMSWVPIASYNNISSPNQIVVGQQIIIPGTAGEGDGGAVPTPTPAPPPDSATFTNYVVQPGDTLSSIGLKFGVSPQEIAEANGLVNPNLIHAGQVLKIPTNTPETLPEVTHTVQNGQTIYSISLIYGVHWLSIAQENNITAPYVIYPGQSLTIPGG